MTLQNDIVELAHKWVAASVPYRHRGISMRGCDCTGLLIGLLQALGKVTNYTLRKYSMDWNMHAGAGDYIRNELKGYAYPIPPHIPAQVGDVVLFRFGKCVSHAGILVDTSNKLFIHCYKGAGKCVYSTLKDSQWGKRFVEYWRLDETQLD